MRVSNCALAFAILRAGRLPALLAETNDLDRVKAYLDKLSAKTNRPIADVLDLSLREIEAFCIAIEKSTKESIEQPTGSVIPGCSVKETRANPRGKRVTSPYG